MVKLDYSIASDHPCFIPGVGTFEAGEKKILDENAVRVFEAVNGHKFAAGNFAPWVHVTVEMTNVDEEV